jgi:hypothetical protein
MLDLRIRLTSKYIKVNLIGEGHKIGGIEPQTEMKLKWLTNKQP